RLDVWLWRARFFKTRALAAQAISKRGVRLTRFEQTRRTAKPSAGVAVGDTLTFTRGSHIETIEVTGLGHRRGPASEAQNLYIRRGDEDV
ncbi:MAG: RNA-binding S4 domain-containing protein, partial [Hyphomonadaceae bacterium]|nr:RNA-binding S4 domain-containing protein [Hyphomonadaceae bacterium]